jgi:hypothetical protein
LVEPDARIRQCGCGQRSVQAQQRTPAPGQSREADREQAEGEHEGSEEDRAQAQVIRPEQRKPGPRDDGCERERHRAELAVAVVGTQELPAESDDERSDDGVEGQE